jgi:predicted unusual protein kinase regulating ubiquinone biosynthesis (AarF/ABC1/UbiB family)
MSALSSSLLSLYPSLQLYDRETDTLTVLDVGLVSVIEPDMSKSFGDFLRALVNLDPVWLCQSKMG